MKNKSSKYTFIEWAVVLVIAFTLIAAIAGIYRNVAEISEGRRVGVITKFSHKGLFIKSYEGELNMGGVRNETDSEMRTITVANTWKFSCSDPRIASQIEALIGKEVIIKYRQSFAGFERDTSYDVVSVERVKPDSNRE